MTEIAGVHHNHFQAITGYPQSSYCFTVKSHRISGGFERSIQSNTLLHP